MMYQDADRPRYMIPALGRLYAAIEVYGWALVRVATGLFFVPHGMQKLFGFWGGNMAMISKGFAGYGLHPAAFWAYYIGCLEFFGGLLLAFGLLTRPIAALFAGFMFVAAFHVTIQRGYFMAHNGMEVSLYLLLISLALLIRGGGAVSLDRLLGREF